MQGRHVNRGPRRDAESIQTPKRLPLPPDVRTMAHIWGLPDLRPSISSSSVLDHILVGTLQILAAFVAAGGAQSVEHFPKPTRVERAGIWSLESTRIISEAPGLRQIPFRQGTLGQIRPTPARFLAL